jgi:hypothetical protein
MHDTTLPLGKYAKDPRFQIVKVDGRDAIRTDRVTIIQGSYGGFEVWELADPAAVHPAWSTRHLSVALRHDLGEPVQVGPVGIQDWMHTDGRTYRHDPAITGMMPADSLRAGDVVDFPHIDAFEILGPAEIAHDELGRPNMGYPARRINGGFNVRFTYRSGDMVPVRFAR